MGRGRYLSVFLIFILLHIIVSRGHGLEWSFLLPCPHSRLSGTLSCLLCLSCLPPFIVSMVGLPPHHILRHDDPLRNAVRIPKILHKNTYVVKKWKLTQLYENELEKTHPWVDDPFP
jgi:hypothetical protein